MIADMAAASLDLHPLFIFVHLHKTAGTSLQKHVKHNLGPDGQLLIEPDMLGVDPHKPQDVDAALQTFFEKNAAELAAQDTHLKFVQSHLLTPTIGPLLKQHLPTPRRHFTFTILREPAKRILSLYNYYAGWYATGDAEERAKPFYKKLLLVDGKLPDFETWYERRFKTTPEYAQ
jgi:hypothetical protein